MNPPDLFAEQLQMSLQNLSTNQSTCSIFKVPSDVRSVNDRAYEPEILSIGPYHRGKDDLKMMEEHKKHYLHMFLQRRPENSLTSYVEAMRGFEERARQYYHQPVSLDKDVFVEMLFLDGCFIVELICRIVTYGPQQGDPVTGKSKVLYTVTRDMLLLENQLPFCVLLELFSMVMQNEREDLFVDMALDFFKWMFPGSRLERSNIISSQECKHLLDLVYHNCLLPSPFVLPSESEATNIEFEFIRSAKELKEAGIRFRKQEGSYGLFHGARFENGMLKIPCLTVEDSTESLFRNLIAYEQCSQSDQHLYVTDYIALMDCLISTQEDVQILRHCGIIKNGLRDDEMVCMLFNNLGTDVMISVRDRFYYAKLFERVEEHCAQRRNVLLAKLRRDYLKSLRRDYLNSPWSIISIFAAFSLLLLTLMQTVFTVMSYYK
ncbi:hypothetical protein OIU85_025471 [Salix viminalis]|uniref:Uncharacterized protein n=1 Tax=Salix viminalis TaxID=40686 RepID=A0A9Q0YXL1_SALVM|nr:hypothetical protein OIU85_025471 [Salix viminalis]